MRGCATREQQELRSSNGFDSAGRRLLESLLAKSWDFKRSFAAVATPLDSSPR